MPRPPDEEKRRDLAIRAVEVLRAEGVEVPMARLAEALGVKRPTLLYHFPTKSHIVERALEALLTEQAAYVVAEVARYEHPIEQLYAQLRAVHAFHHGREPRIVFLTQAIAACAGERLDAVVDVGNRVFAPHREAMAERIARGIEQGTVHPCDPQAVIAIVRAAIDGLMVQRFMTGLDLAPVHELLWTGLLRPLITKKGLATCSDSVSKGDR